MGKQKFNPLLPKRFQELSTAAGGGEDLAATLVLGNITGGTDIILTSGDYIQASASTSQISLDSGVYITTDLGVGAEGFLQLSAVGADLYFGADSKCEMDYNSANVQLYPSIGIAAYAYVDTNEVGAQRILGALNTGISVVSNSSSPFPSEAASGRAVYINSGSSVGLGGSPSVINVGVDNSVAVGGRGLTIKTNNTAYTNQISLQPNGNTFDGLLVPPALSGDQTYTFQDASGTVAFLSDITGGGYIQTGTTVNATPFLLTSSKAIANGTVQSFVTRVTAISTVLGNVWCHEFRGAIKQFGGVTSIVDTVTDEMIAEDVATAAWGTAITAVPGSMSVTVTGAAVNIKWKAETIFSEIVI
jgi:hypothetical protein